MNLSTRLKTMTLDQILHTPELPHRLIVYFASQCAKDALSNVKNPDPRSTAAVDMTERYGLGEEISLEERVKVADAAASYAAASAAASYAATEGKKLNEYKQLLTHLINTRLSEVEKLLIFN